MRVGSILLFISTVYSQSIEFHVEKAVKYFNLWYLKGKNTRPQSIPLCPKYTNVYMYISTNIISEEKKKEEKKRCTKLAKEFNKTKETNNDKQSNSSTSTTTPQIKIYVNDNPDLFNGYIIFNNTIRLLASLSFIRLVFVFFSLFKVVKCSLEDMHKDNENYEQTHCLRSQCGCCLFCFSNAFFLLFAFFS